MADHMPTCDPHCVDWPYCRHREEPHTRILTDVRLLYMTITEEGYTPDCRIVRVEDAPEETPTESV